jgi:hypothetical protein
MRVLGGWIFSTLLLVLAAPASALDGNDPGSWPAEWPKTDFSQASISFDEIKEGGPPKDGIPPIDEPVFARSAEVDLPDIEPVIGVILEGTARAYPIRILIWHEIVNDQIGDAPISVTFCPLCNTGIVFDRRIAGDVLDFGTTGKLRNSDLVMYDRQTESWWQQFTGEAIVGEMTGTILDTVPARLESFANFKRALPRSIPEAAGSWFRITTPCAPMASPPMPAMTACPSLFSITARYRPRSPRSRAWSASATRPGLSTWSRKRARS